MSPGIRVARMAGIVVACSLTASPAAAARTPLRVGIEDDPVFVRLPSSYGGLGPSRSVPGTLGYERAHALGARILRIAVRWSIVQPARSEHREDWSYYDRAVDGASGAGFEVQMVLSGPAPAFATGNGRVGVYRPRAADFGRFVEAAVRRYHRQVATYSVWNEPNWWSSLKPNRDAAAIYRRLYEVGYAAIKRLDPSARVLIGELAPMGYPEAAIPPLRFLRELTCATTGRQPAARCRGLVADGFALHPYTLRWRPTFPGKGGDDVTTGSLQRIVGVLHRLAELGSLTTPSGAAPGLYLTEYGWHARYPPIDEVKRAAYATAGFGLASHQPQVQEIVWYQLAAPPRSRRHIWDTALLTARGQPRPVFTALQEWIAGNASATAARQADRSR